MGLRYQQMVKDGNVLYCICTDSTFSFFETSDAFPQTNIAQVIRNAQGLKDVYLSLNSLELVVRFTKKCSCREFQESQANKLCSYLF